jgi:serine/threonine protein kinase
MLTDELIDLGVVAPKYASTLERMERRASDSRAFLAGLYRAGRLTRLQAIQIGRGRAHHLVVGPYLLMERLGSGGMGRVFLARHRRFGKLAAVKLVRFDRRHCSTTRARFLREVRLIGRLNHENVVHAHDAGKAHGSFYLAMEYIPGPDLGRVIMAEGRIDVGRACEYARQAALGLAHIHERGLIHRDLKPSNLALAADGRVLKVLDVGMARLSREGGSSLSQARKLLGSPDYAAPEQILDSRRVDPRADLYSLGCSLYHLLTGRVPFPGGTSVEKALKHLSESPRPIEDLRSNLPEGLGDLVRKLMMRRRTHRFRTAIDAAAALADFAEPITSPPAGSALDYATPLPTADGYGTLPPLEVDSR